MTFLLLPSFVPQDKIANKKFVITYAKTTNAHAEFELKNYCVPMEDVKLLRRN